MSRLFIVTLDIVHPTLRSSSYSNFFSLSPSRCSPVLSSQSNHAGFDIGSCKYSEVLFIGISLQRRNHAEATLQEIHEQLIEQFVGREEENRALHRENKELYFWFTTDDYIEKFGYDPVDPNK